MSLAQAVFLVGLSLVLALIVAFTVLVVRGAARVDGAAIPSVAMLARLARSPRERAEANRWAFYTHRITGFGIFAFLVLHVLDVSVYALSPAAFDDMHAVYGSVVMRVFECLLLFALLFHAGNGLRLFAVDVGDLGVPTATRLLGAVVAATVVLGAAGSVVILRPLAG